MTKLDKIIFTADLIEPNRKMLKDMDVIRKEALSDLDRAVYHILKNSLDYLGDQDDEMDPMTIKTYEYYAKIVNADN
jgi:nicotinate-nucleotide adenylyltransferase